MDKYLEQAKMLIKCQFGVFGVGYFDVGLMDLAHILYLLDKKKWKELEDFYNKLHDEVFE